MKRLCLWFFVPLLVFAAAGLCQVKAVEITDPEEAKKDPDFLIQGEYLGESAEAKKSLEVGAQVIALSKGQFDIVLYEGGLPGAGWKRGGKSSNLGGISVGQKVLVSGAGMEGTIDGGTMTLTRREGGKYRLKRTERKSATLAAKAPADGKVLFDGTSADNFKDGTLTKNKNLMANATSKPEFGDYRLHVEFRLSYMPDARGQARSNSGVYPHDCYEIQVLDSFGLKGENNECGSYYSIREPAVNMCFPPLVWQTYDIDFTAPKYEGKKKVANARITVKHNGVLIHDNVELPKATPGREKEGPAPRPFYLQGHGNKVEYRNIWVVEKK